MLNPNFFHVHIIKCTSQLFYCLVKPRIGISEYYGTFVYAFNDARSRKELRQDLKLIKQDDVAWVWMKILIV